MRSILQGVLCFLCVSMSDTMSAQADINDYMNAQVTGTKIFMEYDHQKMLDEIDALTTQLATASSDACSNLATVTYDGYTTIWWRSATNVGLRKTFVMSITPTAMRFLGS